ncbi:hypothetical protein [Duncaniella muris]|uniref:hypothetical protein n=1 Tax=Duncaniella muris TaxID=2094150 RepID=UPI0027299692|nr:hypothetical protein [Duncaniella muris]
MTNNDIKHIEATQLNNFLDTLTYWERVEFVTDVVKRAGVKRQTFFNWKCMACRIPEHAKQIIESEAGEHIFVEVIPAETEPQI